MIILITSFYLHKILEIDIGAKKTAKLTRKAEALMALTTQEISKYILNKYVGPYEGGHIFLYEGSNAPLGTLYFGLNNRTPPASSYMNNKYLFHYRARDWSIVVDMLRNEKPLYIHWDNENNQGYLSTSKEPVGEEESTP